MSPHDQPATATPSTDTDIDGVLGVGQALLLMRAGRALSSAVRRALRRTPMSLELWLVLEYLAPRPRSVTELASALGAPKGTASRWSTRAQQLGLLDCHSLPQDLRTKRLLITDLGRQQLDDARCRVSQELLHFEVSCKDFVIVEVLCRTISAIAAQQCDGGRR